MSLPALQVLHCEKALTCGVRSSLSFPRVGCSAQSGTGAIRLAMNIAYLVNRYPTVSHTFVRREIDGIEAAGHRVHRFSIRAAPDELPDPADRAERERTSVVLGRALPLLATAARVAIARR
jgi:hypothetical protein